MTECPTCDGEGMVVVIAAANQYDADTWTECPDCDGTGEVDPEQMREDAAYRAAEARWQDDRTAYAG